MKEKGGQFRQNCPRFSIAYSCRTPPSEVDLLLGAKVGCTCLAFAGLIMENM